MAEEPVDIESLENLLAPFCYGGPTPLPPTLSGQIAVPFGIHYRGFLSKDCKWGCVYNRSIIQCFPVDSGLGEEPGQRGQVPIVISTTPYQFPSDVFISCSAELIVHNQRTTSGISKLLLGLKRKNDRGLLVIFDPIQSRPIKFIHLPAPATSVTVLSHFEEGGSNRPYYNEAMMTMVGIAAVGMQGGQVLIIDLGLDHSSFSSFHSASGPNPMLARGQSIINAEEFTLFTVHPHEPQVATKRHHAVGRNKLFALSVLNETEDEDELEIENNFSYCKPNGEIVRSFLKSSAKVSCLEYIPAIASLVVGFSFGGFQIWRIDNLELIFSSNLSTSTEDDNSVFGFSFSQPVDDPMNYCYLWVMYGKAGIELGCSYLELHCLAFNDKPYVENFGFIYEDLRRCVKRMTIKLEDVFCEQNLESEERQVVNDDRFNVRPVKIWDQPESSLTFFAWQSARNGTYYIGIFDLNQWYSSRTLDFIWVNPDSGLCPYWLAIPVDTPDCIDTYVWDIRIVPKTIERWENLHSKLDVHFYPASISFKAVSLAETGVSTMQHFGVQEKLIRKLLNDGPTLMIKPADIKQKFKTYGLDTVYAHKYDNQMSQVEKDRYYIFSVLLECRRPALIVFFAATWLDGSYANVGCTVDLILDWIASYTLGVRLIATEHWENIFQFSKECLPSETPRFINYSNFLWNALYGLLTKLTGPEEVYLMRESFIDDLEFGLNKLVQYSASLLMMYKAGTIPERGGPDIIAELTVSHKHRRQTVQDAIQNCEVLDRSMKNIRPMMIDYLLEAFDQQLLREQWKLSADEALYPPKDIGYILNMFFYVHSNPKDISRVIAYFLLDLREIADVGDGAKLRGDFQSVIQLTTEEQAEVFNLWLLDHGFAQETLVFLSQKNRFSDSADELPWYAAVVVCTALGMDEDVLEVLQKSCPSELRKLYMNLMVKSPSGYASLCDSICNKDFTQTDDVLYNFFKISDERDCLSRFIQTKLRYAPLNVTDALIAYLKENGSFDNNDRLLAIYAQSEDYKNTSEQYTKMKTLYEGKLTDDQKCRWLIRESLIKRFLSTKRENPILKFLYSSTSSQQVFPSKAAVVIKPQKAATTPPCQTNSERGQLNLPYQLKRLKLLTSKPSDVLSPLRRYAGRLHTVLATPRTSLNRQSLSRQSISFIQSSLNINRPQIIEEVIEDEENDEGEPRPALSPMNSTHNRARRLSSPIDLQKLLEPPSIDHRVARRSMSFFSSFSRLDVESEMNQSIYGTPSSSIHSIMKVENSVTPSRPVESRFLDLSSEPETPEKLLVEEVNETPEKLLVEKVNKTPDKILHEEPVTKKSKSPEKLLVEEVNKTPEKLLVEKVNKTPDKILHEEPVTKKSKSPEPTRNFSKTPESISEEPATKRRKLSKKSKSPESTKKFSKTPESIAEEPVIKSRKLSKKSRSPESTHVNKVNLTSEKQSKTPESISDQVNETLEKSSEEPVSRTRKLSTKPKSPESACGNEVNETLEKISEEPGTSSRKISTRERTPESTSGNKVDMIHEKIISEEQVTESRKLLTKSKSPESTNVNKVNLTSEKQSKTPESISDQVNETLEKTSEEPVIRSRKISTRERTPESTSGNEVHMTAEKISEEPVTNSRLLSKKERTPESTSGNKVDMFPEKILSEEPVTRSRKLSKRERILEPTSDKVDMTPEKIISEEQVTESRKLLKKSGSPESSSGSKFDNTPDKKSRSVETTSGKVNITPEKIKLEGPVTRSRKLSQREKTPESTSSGNKVDKTPEKILSANRSRQLSKKSESLESTSENEDEVETLEKTVVEEPVTTSRKRSKRDRTPESNTSVNTTPEKLLSEGPLTRSCKRLKRDRTPESNSSVNTTPEKLLSEGPVTRSCKIFTKEGTPEIDKNESRKVKRPRRKVFDFAPDLSSILEDPMEETERNLTCLQASDHETEVKNTKRRRKGSAKQEEDEELNKGFIVTDSDDAKSDISTLSTRSSRSTRSTKTKSGRRRKSKY